MVNIFKDKKFLKECAIILLVGAVVNGACFFMCSLTGHCANENPNDAFPYQIGIPSNVPIPSEIVSLAMSRYVNILSTQYGYDGSGGALCFLENNDGNRYIITCCDELTFDISNYPTTFVYRATHQHWVQFLYNADTGVLSDGSFYGGYVATWTLSAQSLATTSHGYILGSVQDDFYASYGSSTVKVWTKNGGNVSDLIGEFTDLPNIDEILNNIQNNWQPPSITGHALPSTPQENPNNNSFQDRLQMFQYLADTITQNFGNLGYNLQQFFNKLFEKLTNVGNSISTNIHNGFLTLMQNIKDFFGLKLDYIIEKFDYITEPVDSTTILNGLEEEDFYGDFSDLKDFHGDLESLFDIQEPSEFTLAIHFENFHDDFYSNVGTQEIDISFLHNSTLFRTFCWVVVCSGLTFIVASGIPSMLRGDKGD